MTNKKGFWLAQMAILLALYALAVVLALLGKTDTLPVRLSLVILAVHVLEIPVAFYVLKGRQAQTLRVIGGTLLFGLLWWLPARRGVFAIA